MNVSSVSSGQAVVAPPTKKQESEAPSHPDHPVMTLIEKLARTDESGQLVDERA